MAPQQSKNLNQHQDSVKQTQQRTERKSGILTINERRNTPHWSLIIAALILFAFMLFLIRDVLNPLIVSIGILILLYPSRRTREMQPMLILIFIIALFSIWMQFSTLIIPFIVAFTLAFALDPVVEWLVNRKLPRMVVILGLLVMVLGAMVGVGILVVPRLIEEIGDLASNVPKWLDGAKYWGIHSLLPWLQALPFEDHVNKFQEELPQILNKGIGKFANWSSSALSGIVNILSGIINLILIPILTIYFLNEFKRIKEWSFSIVPDEKLAFVQEIFSNVNVVLSAYIRGQLLVCTFIATWIGTGLWLFAGVPYALLLGITAGIANLIPYVGTYSAAIITIVIAATQPDPIMTIFKSLIVFISAQALEGNLITPRVVGNRVGLHPLVVIFAVLLFASLFGIVGMLIAIPVTAIFKEVILVVSKHRKMNATIN
ncbi:MAG: AI-2E family transporter [Calditrichaeota bacterium]|jgi:predicted PurR-regulated permease PerM|nr:AI-2E family transporter [Calditrichota bacterium]MBT7788719.1 AI-2E family transporter [Calditrichota bacterium]